MLYISMNFDISVPLIFQISTIICDDIKYITKRKKYIKLCGLGKTHDKKR